MAICINQSGTYRNITSLCINQSGTYRNTGTGCINQSGTYRLFGFLGLGSAYQGGFLVCCASPVRWVVSPASASVCRLWSDRNESNTRSQEVSGCSGWFVPTIGQLQNPGFICRFYWGPSPCFTFTAYWTSTDLNPACAATMRMANGVQYSCHKTDTKCLRSFRTVSY